MSALDFDPVSVTSNPTNKEFDLITPEDELAQETGSFL
jgi:hypothetical protein